MTFADLQNRDDLTAEQKAELWLKHTTGDDFYEHLTADEGFSGFWAKWLNFSYETVPNAISKTFNISKYLALVLMAVGGFLLYKKFIKKGR